MTTMLLLLLLLGLASTPAAFRIGGQQHRTPRLRPSSATRAADASSSPAPPPSLFVFGLGYVGKRLATDLAGRGWRVSGTSTRTPTTEAAQIGSFAFDPTAGRLLDPTGLTALQRATHLLVAIPPLALRPDDDGGKEDAVLACYGAELQTRCSYLRWIGYLSSTSVYGDRDGGWASESQADLAPVSPQGKARMRAEEGWKKVVEGGWGAGRSAPQLVVFRLAGIYGPGRSALDTLLRAVDGQQGPVRFPVDGERLVSRVHVDDIVRVVRCAMMMEQGGDAAVENGKEEQQPPGVRVYNVADDRPASRLEVFSYAARLLASRADGADERVTVVAAAEEGEGNVGLAADTRTRSGRPPESKRVDNGKMKAELLARRFPEMAEEEEEEEGGGLLLYKDYVAGLDAISREMTA